MTGAGVLPGSVASCAVTVAMAASPQLVMTLEPRPVPPAWYVINESELPGFKASCEVEVIVALLALVSGLEEAGCTEIVNAIARGAGINVRLSSGTAM